MFSEQMIVSRRTLEVAAIRAHHSVFMHENKVIREFLLYEIVQTDVARESLRG